MRRGVPSAGIAARVSRRERAVSGCAGQCDANWLIASVVQDVNGWALRVGHPSLAPVRQRNRDREKLKACLGEAILVALAAARIKAEMYAPALAVLRAPQEIGSPAGLTDARDASTSMALSSGR
jgi:hypothetical protein